ncbi:MAG: anti-sigma factor [Actinomycetota bacterium]|nr:anti-sigma factor [Actinomycetota bacterium]
MPPSDLSLGTGGHLDPEDVALHALGEPLDGAASAHLQACPSCASDLSALAEVVAVGRVLDRHDTLEAPPPRVWEAIRSQLTPDLPVSGPSPDAELAPIVSLAGRRRRWPTGLLVAASVLGVLVGSVATSVVTADPSPETPVAAPVATASLAALPAHAGAGSAEIVEGPEGPQLVLDVAGLSPGDGFYEVWLIDPETFAMVGLGALPGTRGTFPVPAGLDLSTYSVVDVSIEPYDGDPLHSKDSVVRGELST